ncbi:MAG: rRNA maturation RNase YbeY [Desulfotignum sp.]|nr:rRNA maturation RNase YbeY [Desulfotignum sp.]MCF8112375.1 rRNA maturation RNase YbeY [Desulfotignum sp.]MCF8125167.1 rRNA maturation RNase YbeY [Desulfotignum sp.]
MKAQKIWIDNRQKQMVSTRTIRKKTEQILNALDYDLYEISIVITDDAQIQQLNHSFRGISTPTNVLAFAMQEGEFSSITPELLGDVVISAQTAGKEAEKAGITLDERISQLLIHGILHLLGFDHDAGESGADEMETKSLELLKLVETNPDLTAF